MRVLAAAFYATLGIEYRSGPHHYKPKTKSLKTRTSQLGKASGVPPAKTSKIITKTKAKPAQDAHLLEAEDTLETESSSSDLLPGL